MKNLSSLKWMNYFVCLFLFVFTARINATTLFLKPNATDGIDAYLDQNTGNNNYGFHTDLSSISWTCSPNCNARGVLRFNLSSIPSNAIITSAHLSLFANPTPSSLNPPPMQGANQSLLQRITSNWSENTVTWNTAPSTTTLNQVTLAQSTNSYQNYLAIDVMNLVQDMVSNPATSFGFLLRLVNETPLTSMTFASSDYYDASKRPEITIEYIVPVFATEALSRSVFCAGSPVGVTINSNYTYNPGNVFTAQLSSANGSFANPVNIGSVSSATVTTVPVIIPINSPYGNNYRIRIISSNPSLISSDNGTDFIIPDPDDNDPCTIDQCDLLTGVVTHDPINVDDNNACTIDECDRNTGHISHTPIAVSDNNACTEDACDPFSGSISHIGISSDDNNACTFDGCDYINGVYHISVNIDDGNSCTIDACDPLTAAITHSVINTDDQNACTTDGCDNITGVYHIPFVTDDNNACTIDACDQVTGVVSHTIINSDDNNLCTFDGCDFITGVFHISVNIDDGNACTNDACDPLTAIITHTVVNTDDQNACTADGCNAVMGVFHIPFVTDDNNACTIDACDQLTGVVSHIIINSDDNNLCTFDGCDFITGVFHIATNVDDGNACTVDACDPATALISHAAVVTDDNNACTFDGCDAYTGVYHTILSVDDNNECTVDGCDPSTGVYHNSVNTDDGNACTVDECDPSTGLVSHIGPDVNDNDPCTIDGCDQLSGQIFHTPNAPAIQVTYLAIPCYGGQTCITVSATGGQPPYYGTGTFCNYSTGNYTIDVIDDAGCNVSNSISINQPDKITIQAVATPTSCSVNDGEISVTVSGGVLPYSYLWMPGGQTTSSISGLGAGNYSVTVIDGNGCTANGSASINVNGSAPSNPGIIAGPAGACRNQSGVVYSVAPVAGATFYQWSLPLGVTGTSMTNSITLSFSSTFSGGFISVSAENPCGSSSPSSKNITLITSKPGSVAQMSGPSKVCVPDIVTYCIPSVSNATYYSWVIEGNGGTSPLSILSGQGTTCLTINVPAGYSGKQKIKVRAENCKGNSGWRKKDIRKTSLPHAPGSISGPVSVCSTQAAVFSIGSVGGATSYLWSVSGGAIIVSGQGTKSVGIDFSSSVNSNSVVSVAASNSCGSSAQSALTVNVNLNCRTTSTISVNNTDDDLNIDVSVYPNPTSGNISVSFNSSAEKEYYLNVNDLLGRNLFSKNINSVKGENNLNIDLSSLPKGIYIVRFEDTSINRSFRIVLE